MYRASKHSLARHYEVLLVLALAVRLLDPALQPLPFLTGMVVGLVVAFAIDHYVIPRLWRLRVRRERAIALRERGW